MDQGRKAQPRFQHPSRDARGSGLACGCPPGRFCRRRSHRGSRTCLASQYRHPARCTLPALPPQAHPQVPPAPQAPQEHQAPPQAPQASPEPPPEPPARPEPPPEPPALPPVPQARPAEFPAFPVLQDSQVSQAFPVPQAFPVLQASPAPPLAGAAVLPLEEEAAAAPLSAAALPPPPPPPPPAHHSLRDPPPGLGPGCSRGACSTRF
mmetsp:Transcript_57725/g.137366  ORF Transcript_57725/g.137366 Transcript_57725/m.137366 type:complete len:208 (+) Transcript_57725:421-1044(+)